MASLVHSNGEHALTFCATLGLLLPRWELNPYSMNLKDLSDKDLYQLCKEYGLNARVWRRRFAGLLPEVLERRLYKKRGYTSIYEFASKLASMSKESVDKVLCISRKLVNKPLLKEQLVSGDQGWSKLEKVAFISTPETDKFWAEKVSSMTQDSLEAYVQEVRRHNPNGEINRLSFTLKSDFQPEKSSTLTFHLKPELEKKFRMFKYQLERERREPLTFEDALEELLAPHWAVYMKKIPIIA